ncbi:DUF748 domain-containing protein [Pelomonas sp. SE-A7]|uniref:DUF748 domain-containing protein n=1 Tax=Pelomonas sp. SE-A7 TaxID=3054953 RepID=UPI00259CD8CB|nr:DUF748 domain-containing protein [Pelomonas sp. SE-A7]MDM4765116.1 DUF748 domain-containing protein [Pelomonas sp. SE-A7]
MQGLTLNNKMRRWLLVVAAVILLPLLLAWALLPGWIEKRGAQLASEALGRPVTIGAAHFQPWRLGLVLEALRIGPAPGGDEDLLQVQRIDTRVSWRSLIHLSPVLGSLSIEQPVLRVTQLDERHSSIDDLLKRFAAKPDEAPAGKEPDFALYNIRLLGGQVLVDDRPAGCQHRLDQLDLELPFVSSLDTDEQVQVQPRLQGRLNGVAFGSQASLRPFDPRHDGSLDFKLAETDLQPYAVYLPKDLPLQLVRGKLSAEFKLTFSRPEKQAPQLDLSGQLRAADWALSQSGREALAWQGLQLGIAEFQPLQRKLRFGDIQIDGLALQLRRDARGQLQLPMPASPPVAASAPAAAPWNLAIDKLSLRKASLALHDDSVATKLKLDPIELRLQSLKWPLVEQPARFELSMGLDKAQLSAKGELSKQALKADAQVQDFSLTSIEAYLKPVLPLKLSGKLNTAAAVQWEQPLEAGSAPQLSLRDLKLEQLKAGTELSLASLTLDQAEVLPAKQRVKAGQLRLAQPRATIKRAEQGGWNFEQWLPPAHDKAAAGNAAPWQLSLAGLSLEQGQVEVQDASMPRPVHLVASEVGIKLQELAWGQPASSPLQVALKLGSVREGRAKVDESGRLRWNGRVELPQAKLAGRLQIEHLPLGGISPYVEQQMGVRLQRADASWQGDVEVEGPKIQLSGDLQLNDLLLRLARGESREELLSWRSLDLKKLRLALAPNEAPRLAVAESELAEFFARLDIDPQGHFNLRGVQQPEKAGAAAPGPAPQYQLGPIKLSGGKVDFSDRFIRPNYNARLSELEGRIGALSSDSQQMSTVELHGKVAGTGRLEIGGQVAISPLALDIKAQASEIELAPLSPYAGKYAGYAIERGKLSTKLEYKIAPGGQLQANNQVILNQLTFGDKVDSPEATSLPVKFALALLKDRDGVIDINLPVSGSINDPEFSVGGLVWRLFLNLIGKALTSPFSLLAGGGHEDSSVLAMAQGASELGADGMGKLDKLAKALNDRPQLRLSIIGSSSLDSEREALKQGKLNQAIEAERQREQRRDASAKPGREQLLRSVYLRSELKTRPRNLVGLLKELPAAEMEKLLLDSYSIDAEAARQLALARAVLVRDALIARGVPNERLFLAAPKSGAPQVELALEAP